MNVCLHLKSFCNTNWTPVVSFTKEVNPQLAQHPLKINGRLADHGLTFLVKEATVIDFIFQPDKNLSVSLSIMGDGGRWSPCHTRSQAIRIDADFLFMLDYII